MGLRDLRAAHARVVQIIVDTSDPALHAIVNWLLSVARERRALLASGRIAVTYDSTIDRYGLFGTLGVECDFIDQVNAGGGVATPDLYRGADGEVVS